MTAAEAQAALRAIALDLVRVEERCQLVHDSLPWSDNEAAMFHVRIPETWRRRSRMVIEYVGEELRSVVKSLTRVSRVTEAELRREFRKRLD